MHAVAVCGDVDVLCYCPGAFGGGVGEDDFGDAPFDDEVEARDDDVDAVGGFFVEVVDPVADVGWVLGPVEADEVFPVDFVEGVFLDDGELLGDAFGFVG